VICGNCKDRDQTVEHVRDCYAGRTIQSAVKAPIASPVPDLGSGTRAVLPVTEPGVYFDGERYYKVVKSQQDRLYAKVWDAEWVYEAGAMRFLTADMRVNAEQAARFGKLWGSCVFCSRLLTDERSVTVGYGPICAEHNGLPWGDKCATDLTTGTTYHGIEDTA
jgi:hypothetical protein